jgi:hypothetical protein
MPCRILLVVLAPSFLPSARMASNQDLRFEMTSLRLSTGVLLLTNILYSLPFRYPVDRPGISDSAYKETRAVKEPAPVENQRQFDPIRNQQNPGPRGPFGLASGLPTIAGHRAARHPRIATESWRDSRSGTAFSIPCSQEQDARFAHQIIERPAAARSGECRRTAS